MIELETLFGDESARPKWRKYFQPRTAALAAIAAIAAAALAGCGGSSTGTTTARPSAAQPPPSTETKTAIPPNPTSPLYRLTGYDVETTWEQDVSERKVGRYL